MGQIQISPKQVQVKVSDRLPGEINGHGQTAQQDKGGRNGQYGAVSAKRQSSHAHRDYRGGQYDGAGNRRMIRQDTK